MLNIAEALPLFTTLLDNTPVAVALSKGDDVTVGGSV
jgi:hypothetical protein